MPGNGDKPLSTQTKLFYGIGAFGYGSVGQTLGSFMMFFGTGILGIPGAMMGLAIAISTVWDATTDPFVGYFSDRTRSKRFGKRHGFILVGCICVAVMNLLLWTISPALPTLSKFLLLLGILLVLETFNTMYSTPYQALGIDLSKSYQDRTAVQGYRTTFSFLSLMVPWILMSIFLRPGRYTDIWSSSRGYVEIALVTSALCIICGLIAFAGTYKHRPIKVEENTEKVRIADVFSNFLSVLKQKNVKRLIIGYAISLSAGAFITTLGLHIFTYTFLFSTRETPFIIVAFILGIVLGQPLWFYYSKRTDKVNSLLTALSVVIVGMLLFSFILALRNSIDPWFVLPLVSLTIFICGLGTGCLYSLPISMYADCIDMEKRRTGVDKTAISAGFLTFCMKISNAFIMFVIGVSLDLIGFRGNMATQSMSVQNWLGWVLVIGVITACLIAMVVYKGYTYNREDFKD